MPLNCVGYSEVMIWKPISAGVMTKKDYHYSSQYIDLVSKNNEKVSQNIDLEFENNEIVS